VARAHRRRRKLPQPEADNSEISGLIAASAALEERVGNMVDEFQREREGAAQHRRDLRLVIEALSASVRGLTATVSEIKPLVDDWRETRAEWRGAARFKKFLLATAVSVAGFAGAIINEVWKVLLSVK